MNCRTFISTFLLLLLSTIGQAETIEVTVNGLVCGFCAQGIEKRLRQFPATADAPVKAPINAPVKAPARLGIGPALTRPGALAGTSGARTRG